jgi:hypothetical protein
VGRRGPGGTTVPAHGEQEDTLIYRLNIMRNAAIEHQQMASWNFNGLTGQLQPHMADEGVDRYPSVYPVLLRLRILFHGN